MTGRTTFRVLDLPSMEPYEPPSPNRESMLTVILTGMVVCFTLLLLVLITGGWIFWLILIVGAMASLYVFHYVVWGKMLNDEVAGEREEEILRQRAGDDGRDL